MYSKLHERGILHGSPSPTNIWLPRPKPARDPQEPSFYLCNWSRARCVDPKSKRSNGSFEPAVPFIPAYTEQEAFWEMRELGFNLDYNKAREAELKKFAQDFTSLLNAAEMRKARVDAQQGQDPTDASESGKGIRHSLGKLFKMLVDIPLGPQAHELRDPLSGEIRIVDNRLDWLWTEREAQELIRMFSQSIHNARKSRNVQALHVAENVAEAARKHLEMHRLSDMSDRQLTVMPADFLKECDVRWYEWDPSFPDRYSKKGKQKAREDVYESDIAQATLYKHDMIQHDDYRGRSQQNAFGLPPKFCSMPMDQTNALHSVDGSLEVQDIHSDPDPDPDLGERGNKGRGARHFFSDDGESTPDRRSRAPTPMPTPPTAPPSASASASAPATTHKRQNVADRDSPSASNHSPLTTKDQSSSVRRVSKLAKFDPRLATPGSESLEQKKQRLKYLEEALIFQAREVEKVVAVGEAVAAFSDPEEAFDELDVFIERSHRGPGADSDGMEAPQHPQLGTHHNSGPQTQRDNATIVTSPNARRGLASSTTRSSPETAPHGLNLDRSPTRLMFTPSSSSPARTTHQSSLDFFDVSAPGAENGKAGRNTKSAIQTGAGAHSLKSALAASRPVSPVGSTSSSTTAVETPATPGTASSTRSTGARKPTVESEYRDAGLVVTPCSANPPRQDHANKGMARGFCPGSTPSERVFTHMDWNGNDSSYSRDSPQWLLDDQPPIPIASDGKSYYYPLSHARGYCERGRKSEAVGRTDVEGFQLPLSDAVHAAFQGILNAKAVDSECPASEDSVSRSNEDAVTVVNASQGSSSKGSDVDYTMWDECFPNRVPILSEGGTVETPPDAELSFDPNSRSVEIDDEWEAACQRDILNRRKGLILNQRVIRLMLWMAAKRETRDVAFYKSIPTVVLSKQAAEVVRYSRAHVIPYDKDESDFQREKQRLEKQIGKFEAISRVLEDETRQRDMLVDAPDPMPNVEPQSFSPMPPTHSLVLASTAEMPALGPATTPTPSRQGSIPATFNPAFRAFHGFSPLYASATSRQTGSVNPLAPPVTNPFSAFGKASPTVSSTFAFGTPSSPGSRPWSYNSATLSPEYHQRQGDPFVNASPTNWFYGSEVRVSRRRDYHHAKFYIQNNVIMNAADVGEVVEEIEVEHIVREDFDMEDRIDDRLVYETPDPGPPSPPLTKRARDESSDEDSALSYAELPRRAKRYRCVRKQM